MFEFTLGLSKSVIGSRYRFRCSSRAASSCLSCRILSLMSFSVLLRLAINSFVSVSSQYSSYGEFAMTRASTQFCISLFASEGVLSLYDLKPNGDGGTLAVMSFSSIGACTYAWLKSRGSCD